MCPCNGNLELLLMGLLKLELECIDGTLLEEVNSRFQTDLLLELLELLLCPYVN